jgi:hypothetical protein
MMKMKREQFHRELESIIEAPKGSLTPESKLAAAGQWDSMAILSFISFVDLSFGAVVDGVTASKAVTVKDLEGMLEGFLEG